jgi:predicted transcriptional regulator
MLGLFFGKPRSKLGKFLDSRGISQEWLASKTDISRNTISKITSDKSYSPRLTTIKKIMKAIREVDPGAKPEDFFDI